MPSEQTDQQSSVSANRWKWEIFRHKAIASPVKMSNSVDRD